MRFSTNDSVLLIHDTSSNFKKVLSTIVKKLPHNNQKVSPVSTAVKNDKKTVIKVVAKSSAITKEDDVYRNLRNYYTTNKKSSNTTVVEDVKVLKDTERQTRHKAVKQYQQSEQIKKSSVVYHWKEHSTVSNNTNIAAPLKFQTHDYIRDTRSNSNFLRIQAMTNHSSSKVIINNQKPYLKKRQDAFVWGNPSKLRNVIACD